MKNKLRIFFNSSVNIVYLFIISFILFNIFIVSYFVKYYGKKDFVFLNFIPLLLFIILIYLYKNGKISLKFKFNFDKKRVLILSFVFFVIAVILFYSAYFITGWDSFQVTDYAYNLLNKRFDLISGWRQHYYEWYPNNSLITLVYFSIFKIASFLKIGSFENLIFLLIIFQCALCFISAFISFNIVNDYTKSTNYGFLAWLITVIFVCFSPWIMIPYTDASSILIPLIILRLFQKCIKKYKDRYLVMISFISFIAFKLKPQSFIISISILLYVLFNFKCKVNSLTFLKRLLLIAVPFLICIIPFKYVSNTILHVSSNAANSITYNHYLMMGLNDKTDGAYYQLDVDASLSVNNTSDRVKYNNEIIKKRIKNFGTVGLIKHIVKKTLVIYNDGTFAWNMEGTFYNRLLNKNNVISSASRNFYYVDGKYIGVFNCFFHFAWLIILIGISFLFKKSNNPIILVTKLMFIGIFLFELLFEARARYIFCVFPIMIIMFCLSVYEFNLNKKCTK